MSFRVVLIFVVVVCFALGSGVVLGVVEVGVAAWICIVIRGLVDAELDSEGDREARPGREKFILLCDAWFIRGSGVDA